MRLPTPLGKNLLLLTGTLLCLEINPSLAGQCWSLINRSGRCTESLRTNVTREECCSDGSATTAWSPKDLRSGDLFFWMSLGGGVVCKACKVSCEGVICSKGMKCVIRKQKPACVCDPKCSRKKRQMGEVCGSDGRTYRHICRLLKRQCRRNKQLTVEYFGKCQKNCDKVHCTGRKTCLLDQVLRPHCVRCQYHCLPGSVPGGYICGGDNVTYSSYCHMRQAACLKGRSVPEAYRGKCKAGTTCDVVRCRKGKRCLVDPSGGPPRCVTCPRRCHLTKTEKLCATNNYTYATWCHMMQDACKHGLMLEVKHPGVCEEQTSHQTNIIPLHVPESKGHL